MKQLVENIKRIVDQNSQADDFELYISYNEDHNTRFAQNAISQHCSGDNTSVYFKVFFGKQSGAVSINDISDEAVINMIKKAEDIARFNMPDPDAVPSLQKMDVPSFNNVSEATQSLTPAGIVEIIQYSINEAIKKEAVLSGNFNKGYSYNALYTKNGFDAEYDFTYFSYSMTMKKDQKETKVEIESKDFAIFDQNIFMQKLISQFDSLDNPVSMEPEKIAVILRPAAVMNYFSYLYWIYNQKLADEGITPFTNQVGPEFFGKMFSMKTSTMDHDLFISPYNSDGLTQDNEWVVNGVIQKLPCSRSWANKTGSSPSVMNNLIIDGGKATEEEMMKLVKRGLIINNFWYIRVNDMKSADFTGMTRDGVLYFEDGQIKSSVNNFRFNDQFSTMTQNILALGPSELTGLSNKMPTMLIKEFNLVDKTSF